MVNRLHRSSRFGPIIGGQAQSEGMAEVEGLWSGEMVVPEG